MISILMAAMLFAAAEPSASAAADTPAAAAAPAVPASTIQAKAETPKGSDKVCWEERPTGSHVSKHFCATRDERDKMEHDAQDAVASRARSQQAPGGFGPSH